MGEDEGGEAPAARRQAARLQTMAGLARPVQHEINNLLTVIFANLEMLKRTAAEGGPKRQLDRVAEAARRSIESGVPQLLDFGITNERAWEVGLACGGKLKVFVERLGDAPEAPAKERSGERAR